MGKVFIRIQGVQRYLWRAADQHDVGLDIPFQARRDASAAKRFFRRLLKGLHCVPRVIVTDKLGSYGVAKRGLPPNAAHRQSRYLTASAETLPRPTRRRERQMQRFKTPRQARCLLTAHAFIYGHLRSPRHRMDAGRDRAAPATALKVWQQETCAKVAA